MRPNTERHPRIKHVNLDEARPFSASMSIDALMDKWLDYKQGFVKESTHSSWVVISENHIKPYFDGVTLGEVVEGDLQDFIVYLYKHGRKDGKGGFAVKTIRDIMLPLKMALKHAYKYNRSLQKIDFEMLEMPKDHNQDKVRSLTHEQQRRFIQSVYLELDRKTAAYLMTVVTGLRIGELCGLQMQDISLIQQTISVTKTVYRVYDKRENKTRVIIDTPKTVSSIRLIPFPEMLVRVLERFYDEKHLEYYFVSGTEKPCEPRTLRQCFDRFMERNGLPHMKFHELRHTFAVRAVEDPDFDIKTLSAILGHKNPSFTLNVYGRTNMERETECMKSMNKWL